MGIHHLAFASADTKATHAFYTELMGFELAKVVVGPTPEGGWARHFFFSTGEAAGQLIAFWELHLPGDPKPKTAISTDLGHPQWVNHLAFTADDRQMLDTARVRWTDAGHEVVELDHEFCVWIYTVDPNGILVEWCMDSRPLDERDTNNAERLLWGDNPEHESPVGFKVHPPTNVATTMTP